MILRLMLLGLLLVSSHAYALSPVCDPVAYGSISPTGDVCIADDQSLITQSFKASFVDKKPNTFTCADEGAGLGSMWMLEIGPPGSPEDPTPGHALVVCNGSQGWNFQIVPVGSVRGDGYGEAAKAYALHTTGLDSCALDEVDDGRVNINSETMQFCNNAGTLNWVVKGNHLGQVLVPGGIEAGGTPGPGTFLRGDGVWAPTPELDVPDGDKTDITVSTDGTVWTIDNGVVTVAKIGALGTPSETTFLRGDGRWATPVGGGGGGSLTDGDKGDITVSGLGEVWTIDNGVVSIAKLSATGTASSSTFLRGDGTWSTTPGVTDGDKGDITVSSSGATWAIDSGAITGTKIADGAVSIAKISASGTPGVGTFLRGDGAWTQSVADGGKDDIEVSGGGVSWIIQDLSVQMNDLDATGFPDNTKYLRGDGVWATVSGGGVSDGDKGDITISGSGATYTIDAGVVSGSKIADAGVGIAKINATGTPSSTTYLRGDGSWATPAGGSAITLVGGDGVQIAESPAGTFTIATKSSEPFFLEIVSSTMSCASGAKDGAVVLANSGTIAQWCSGTAEQFGARGDINGYALNGDNASGFFADGALDPSRGGLGTARPTCVAGEALTCTGSNTCSCVSIASGGLENKWATQTGNIGPIAVGSTAAVTGLSLTLTQNATYRITGLVAATTSAAATDPTIHMQTTSGTVSVWNVAVACGANGANTSSSTAITTSTVTPASTNSCDVTTTGVLMQMGLNGYITVTSAPAVVVVRVGAFGGTGTVSSSTSSFVSFIQAVQLP